MSPKLDRIEADARGLTVAERAELAQRLFASVEDDGEAAAEAEWLAEAERRYGRFLTGETTAAPADEAIARVRARLRGS